LFDSSADWLGLVLVSRHDFRFKRLERRRQGCATLPDLLRTDQQERRVLAESLGVVDILIARHAAVEGLTQEVRERKLRVLHAP
jgi:hypothetical protein